MTRIAILAAIAALAFGGCSKKKPSEESTESTKQTAQPPTAQTLPPGHGAAGPTSPATRAGAGAGKVVETMNSGGYTYVNVDVGGGKLVWAAGPRTAVKVGDIVSFSGGSPMPNYRSTTLDRSFDMIYFVPKLNLGTASAATAAAAAGHGAAAPVVSNPAGTGQASPAPVTVGKIKKAKGGNTIAEVYAQKDRLNGKAIVFRGKVVKYNAKIMGYNWLHVQDGTGAAGTNDLTVTTEQAANVGDTVVVRGTLTRNKDFGSGYKYDVIVEKATLTKE